MKEIGRIEGIIEQQKRWNQAHNYVTIASKQKQIDRIAADLVKPTNPRIPCISLSSAMTAAETTCSRRRT